MPLLSAHCRTPKATDQHEEHHPQQRPPLAGVAHHDAEGVGQGAGDQQDQQDLQEVGERGRVFKGVGRVGVEEAAAVGPQLLDRLLGGDRPHGDGDLLDRHALGDRVALGILERVALVVQLRLVVAGRLDQRHGLVGAEVLDHPLGDQDEGGDQGDRQQDVEGAAGHIDPEVAQHRGLAPHEAADQGNGDRHAGGGGDEVVHRQPHHLGEVAGRLLAAHRPASWCWW